MKDIFNVVVLILALAWTVGFFAFNIGGFIHILLLIAFGVLITRIFRKRRYN